MDDSRIILAQLAIEEATNSIVCRLFRSTSTGLDLDTTLALRPT